MASPRFKINGGAVLVDAEVSAATTVTATLDSLDGIRQVEWSIIGTDETTVIGDYALTPSGLHGSTVTTTSLAAGTAAVLRCIVNAGIDPQTEQPSNAMTATAVFYVLTAQSLRVKALGEDTSATPRDVDIVNGAVRAAGGGGGGSGDVNPTPDTLLLRNGSGDGNVRVLNAIRTVNDPSQPVEGVWIKNTTAATAILNQQSPALYLDGFGWKTNAGGSSVGIRWAVRSAPITGAANPTSLLQFGVETGPPGAGFTQRLRLNSNGFLGLSADVLAFAAGGISLAPALTTFLVDGSVATTILDLTLSTSRVQLLSEGGASTLKAPASAIRVYSATGNATIEAVSTAKVLGSDVEVTASSGSVAISAASDEVTVSAGNGISFFGTVATDMNVSVGGQLSADIHIQAFASPTLTLNFDNSNNQQTTLTGNTTIAFSNLVSGATYRIYLVQDGTGSRTVTWPVTAIWGSIGTPTLSTVPSARDVFVGTSDGTNIYFETSMFTSANPSPNARAFALSLVAGYVQQ